MPRIQSFQQSPLWSMVQSPLLARNVYKNRNTVCHINRGGYKVSFSGANVYFPGVSPIDDSPYQTAADGSQRIFLTQYQKLRIAPDVVGDFSYPQSLREFELQRTKYQSIETNPINNTDGSGFFSPSSYDTAVLTGPTVTDSGGTVELTGQVVYTFNGPPTYVWTFNMIWRYTDERLLSDCYSDLQQLCSDAQAKLPPYPATPTEYAIWGVGKLDDLSVVISPDTYADDYIVLSSGNGVNDNSGTYGSLSRFGYGYGLLGSFDSFYDHVLWYSGDILVGPPTTYYLKRRPLSVTATPAGADVLLGTAAPGFDFEVKLSDVDKKIYWLDTSP